MLQPEADPGFYKVKRSLSDARYQLTGRYFSKEDADELIRIIEALKEEINIRRKYPNVIP